MLHARIASALRKIISIASFGKRVSVEEKRGQKYNRFLRGRPIANVINGHFQSTGAYDTAQGLAYKMMTSKIPIQDGIRSY